MSYLLDVNALLAWEHSNSPHHDTFHNWASGLNQRDFWTCGLTELGFMRVSMQVFGYDRKCAESAMRRIKSATTGFVEISPAPHFPTWVKHARQTTDAYLVQIATQNGFKLATFDRGIRSPHVELITSKTE